MFARAFFCNTIFTPQLETPKSVVHKKTNGRPVFGAAVRCILVKLKGYFFCFSVSFSSLSIVRTAQHAIDVSLPILNPQFLFADRLR